MGPQKDHERAIVDATRAREAALRAELTKSEQRLAATMQQLQEVQAEKVELEEGLSRHGSPERPPSSVRPPSSEVPNLKKPLTLALALTPCLTVARIRTSKPRTCQVCLSSGLSGLRHTTHPTCRGYWTGAGSRSRRRG